MYIYIYKEDKYPCITQVDTWQTTYTHTSVMVSKTACNAASESTLLKPVFFWTEETKSALRKVSTSSLTGFSAFFGVFAFLFAFLGAAAAKGNNDVLLLSPRTRENEETKATTTSVVTVHKKSTWNKDNAVFIVGIEWCRLKTTGTLVVWRRRREYPALYIWKQNGWAMIGMWRAAHALMTWPFRSVVTTFHRRNPRPWKKDLFVCRAQWMRIRCAAKVRWRQNRVQLRRTVASRGVPNDGDSRKQDFLL